MQTWQFNYLPNWKSELQETNGNGQIKRLSLIIILLNWAKVSYTLLISL